MKNGSIEAEDGQGRQWYVMQTKPRQETRVIAQLALRAGSVETFLPKIEVTRKRGGRRIMSLEPMFPSYVFLRTHLDPPIWHSVRWTPGAVRLLGDGERPVAVPEQLVGAIWDRMAPLGFVRIGLNLSPGQRVRVMDGPFAGLEGIFERPTTRQGRVRVLLEMLSTDAPLEIDAIDLERV